MRLRYLVFFIMAFCLRTVHAEEKHVIYTDAQLHGIWLGIKGQCETLAKAEGKPHLYDRCIDFQKAEWKAWHQLFVDPSVSQMVWERCEYETGFRQTLDLHTYNQCLRLAKDRPDLQ